MDVQNAVKQINVRREIEVPNTSCCSLGHNIDGCLALKLLLNS